MSDVHWHQTGTGPVAVLLHAFPCDHRMWAAQVEPIAASGWRVLVPDLPGFAGSALPQDDPDLGVIVEQLNADLAERGVDRFVLGGLSVGGYLAMEWLRRYPQSIAALILCDTKATADSPAAYEGRLAMATEVSGEPQRTSQILSEKMFGPILGKTSHAQRPDVVARVAEWIDSAPAATIAWYQRAMAARPDSLDVLRSLAAPALVVWGEEDEMSPRAEQDLMVECLSDVAFESIPQAGHLAALENPVPVTHVLVEFLAAVRRSSLQG